MMMTYPEHDRLAAIKPQAETVQAFLDWVLDAFQPRGATRGGRVWLAAWRADQDGRDYLSAVRETRAEILAAHFGIDLDALEREKRAMLTEARVGSD
jgi:hypothetical protein